MKQTEYLGLKKPDLNDVFDIEDFNYNADILDAKIGRDLADVVKFSDKATEEDMQEGVDNKWVAPNLMINGFYFEKSKNYTDNISFTGTATNTTPFIGVVPHSLGKMPKYIRITMYRPNYEYNLMLNIQAKLLPNGQIERISGITHVANYSTDGPNFLDSLVVRTSTFSIAKLGWRGVASQHKFLTTDGYGYISNLRIDETNIYIEILHTHSFGNITSDNLWSVEVW